MIKLLVIALLLCATYWILKQKRASKSDILVWTIWIAFVTIAVTNEIYKYTTQIDDMPDISNLSNKPNAEKIYNKEITTIPVTIGRSSEAKIDEHVYVIGNQQALNKTIAEGIIFNKHDMNGDKINQNNAVISHGSSGYSFVHKRKLNGIFTVTHHDDSAQNKIMSSPTEKNKDTTLEPKINNDQITDPQNPADEQSEPVTEKRKILCPSIEKIQQASQQIDDAFLYDGTYRIATPTFAFQESSLSWIVGVRDIVADSSDEAIEIAKITARAANYTKTEYAEPLWPGVDIYMCEYGPGGVGAAGLEPNNLKKLGV